LFISVLKHFIADSQAKKQPNLGRKLGVIHRYSGKDF